MTRDFLKIHVYIEYTRETIQPVSQKTWKQSFSFGVLPVINVVRHNKAWRFFHLSVQLYDLRRVGTTFSMSFSGLVSTTSVFLSSLRDPGIGKFTRAHVYAHTHTYTHTHTHTHTYTCVPSLFLPLSLSHSLSAGRRICSRCESTGMPCGRKLVRTSWCHLPI